MMNKLMTALLGLVVLDAILLALPFFLSKRSVVSCTLERLEALYSYIDTSKNESFYPRH